MHTLLPKLADLQQKTTEERFGKAIGDVSRAWNDKLDQRLKPLGLSQSKWRALLYVSRVPAGINQTDLARMLAIEAPTLTRLVKLLEDEGWVTRRPLPGDARCKMVRLTAKAKKTVTLIEGEVIRLRAETVGRLTPSQLAAGFDAMQALQRHLDEV